MSRYPMMIAAAALAGAVVLTSSPVRAGTLAARAGSGGTWGTAKELPGSASLNAGGRAELVSVSCSSPGDCSAGGSYLTSSGQYQAMVDTQANGTWGTAEEVPGLAVLNAGGGAAITSVSCASPGNCSAGGYYSDGSSHAQVFVVSEAGGTWGNAIEVPGTATLNTSGDARIYSVSCASAGNCSAGGYYFDGSGHQQAFVVSEAGGTWGNAIEVPGTTRLNTAGEAEINSVSCASAGSCSAGGYYSEYVGPISQEQAFVVSEAAGSWGKAKEVPGTGKLNTGGLAATASVSCSSLGDCSAGGSYYDSSGRYHVFVVSQVSGTWGTAKEAPGTAALNKGGAIVLNTVSCGSPGNCGAGGYYSDSSGHYQAFVVSQAGGTWGKAKEVPGTAELNRGTLALISSVSCTTPGDCSAGGYYTDSSGHFQAFVVSQAGGIWGKAEKVPGTTTLNKGGLASIPSVSCAAAGNCSAAGYYTDKSGRMQAFVDSQT